MLGITLQADELARAGGNCRRIDDRVLSPCDPGLPQQGSRGFAAEAALHVCPGWPTPRARPVSPPAGSRRRAARIDCAPEGQAPSRHRDIIWIASTAKGPRARTSAGCGDNREAWLGGCRVGSRSDTAGALARRVDGQTGRPDCFGGSSVAAGEGLLIVSDTFWAARAIRVR